MNQILSVSLTTNLMILVCEILSLPEQFHDLPQKEYPLVTYRIEESPVTKL